jgi:hypothetical protein
MRGWLPLKYYRKKEGTAVVIWSPVLGPFLKVWQGFLEMDILIGSKALGLRPWVLDKEPPHDF